jgi:hypothetical protein
VPSRQNRYLLSEMVQITTAEERKNMDAPPPPDYTNPHFAMLKKPLPDHPKVIRADEIYQEVAKYVKVYVNRGAYDCVCGLYWLQSSLCRHWFKGQPVHCGVADRAGVLTSATRKQSLISRFVQFCSITLANVVDERWDAIRPEMRLTTLSRSRTGAEKRCENPNLGRRGNAQHPYSPPDTPLASSTRIKLPDRGIL